jgi:von Willebrand factor type A domain-containing protein
VHRSSFLHPSLAFAITSVSCVPTVAEPVVTHDAAVEDEGGSDGSRARPELGAADVSLPSPDAPKFTTDANLTSLDANCGAVTHTAQMLPADILIVMDRSLSMTNDQDDKPCLGGGPLNGNCGTKSKWYQVTTALDTVLTNTDTMVNWGLLYFGAESTICGVTTTPAVPIVAENALAINQAFMGQPSKTGQTGTPTRSAVINAVTYMKTLIDPNPKYLLLATDGQPNCAPAGGLNMPDDTGSAEAVAEALMAGFPTFVVGIGDTKATSVLNALASSGGKPVPGAPGGNSFYQVNNAADLETALGQILGTVTTCVFDTGPPPNNQTRVDQISVFGDGNEIRHDAGDGWEFSNGDKTQVTLHGSACEAVTKGTIKSVTVTFGCLVS